MNVIYADHRAFVEEDLGGTSEHPFGGLLLSTGEAVGYDDPALDVEPRDDDWQTAHDPDWRSNGAAFTCTACGRYRGPAHL